MESRLDILDCQEINAFCNYLQQLSDSGVKWNKLYMSVGSKWNELVVPSKTFDNSIWYSNSLDQMMPSFIRYQFESACTLVIIIDEFRDNKSLKINKLLITQNIEDTNNICVCLINKFCSSKDIILDFTNKVVEFSKRHNIHNNNFMICNFVKYLNQPNLYELSSSTIISSSINEALTDTVYNDCLYEWYGYMYGLHTLVYNRNKLYRQPYFVYSSRILQSILRSQRHGLPIYMWKDIPASNLHVFELLKNVHSLDACHEETFNLNTSLYDIIKHNNIDEDEKHYMDNVDY